MSTWTLALVLTPFLKVWCLRLKGRFDPGYFSEEYESMGAGGTQENMLRDEIRVSTYHKAITGNPSDFQGKRVMDVGAGSGLLSLFAAQAGAAKVYSVEVSRMSEVARAIADANRFPNTTITVFNRSVEDMLDQVDEKVDVLVSEPFGELLFHERMIESYIFARDHFLKPGGKMFPSVGEIHLAPFSDSTMHADYHYLREGSVGLADREESFWNNASFYGINLTAATAFVPGESPKHEVIIDFANPDGLMAEAQVRRFDFETVTLESLRNIRIPFDFEVQASGLVHGIAGWFDAMFAGSDATVLLSTAPWCPLTHWWQVHLLMKEPLAVSAGDRLRGELIMEAEDAHMSYRLRVTMEVAETGASSGPHQFDLFAWVFRPEEEDSNWATGNPDARPTEGQCHTGELLPAGWSGA
mmetsp:Transcript_53154/g.154706  ORF Transcript_53154/g.154706 Transcript_53154/m.154706 type:complete len:413 (-) Transcript_53154:44-1282(-)